MLHPANRRDIWEGFMDATSLYAISCAYPAEAKSPAKPCWTEVIVGISTWPLL
jgi:hypothetical protein